VINVADLEATLESASVEIATTGDGNGTDSGNITIGTAVEWSAPTTLRLTTQSSDTGAVGNIIIAAPIVAPSGALQIDALGTITTPTTWTTSDGSTATGGNGAIDVDQFRLFDGDWVQNRASLPSFSANDFSFSASGGASFLRATGGNGSGTPYTLVDIYGVQGIGSSQYLSSQFRLGNDVDASSTSNWGMFSEGDIGFAPIGQDAGGAFTGTLDGNGFAISGLNINRYYSAAGMFDTIGLGGVVRDLTLSDVSVSASQGGMLAARNDGTISGVSAQGDLTGYSSFFTSGGVLGGLVGLNTGDIIDADVSVALSAYGPSISPIGGIAGQNDGTIETSSVAGTLSVADQESIAGAALLEVGGAVGVNTGDLIEVTSTADIDVDFTGDNGQEPTLALGGLAGSNSGTIRDGVSRGDLSMSDLGFSNIVDIGGLAGINSGVIDGSRFAGSLSVPMSNFGYFRIGGLAGDASSSQSEITDSRFVGDISATGFASQIFVGGIAGMLGGTATGTVSLGDIMVDASTGTITTTYVGGVAGELLAGATAEDLDVRSSVDATISGPFHVGGAFGRSLGTVRDIRVDNAQFDVTISDDRGAIGGAIGTNDGTLEAALVETAQIDVSMSGFTGAEIGGAVGENIGTMTDVKTTTSVTVDGPAQDLSVGGIAGNNSGTITRAGASGEDGGTGVTVSALDDGGFYAVGGLVGSNFGDIVDAYATVPVTVTTISPDTRVGGLVGETGEGASIDRTFASGAVSAGTGVVGGLIGQDFGATVTASFWDTGTTGQASSDGGTGLDTATFLDTEGFMALAEPLGWNFFTTWAPPDTSSHPAIYTIDRVIFAVADDGTAIYGDSAAATGSVYGGPDVNVFHDDPIDTSALFTIEMPDEADVGTYVVTTSTDEVLSQNDGDAYRVVTLDGTFSITPRSLTIAANDQTKTYGNLLDLDSLAVGDQLTATGLAYNDTIASALLSSSGEPATANAGAYDISIDSIDFDAAGNYSITFETGTLTVDPRALTVLARDQSKTYGDVLDLDDLDVGSQLTVTGLVNGDTIGSAMLSSGGEAASANAGSYTVTIDSIDFDAAGNYVITLAPGTLTVDPRTLTIRANDQVKRFGDVLDLDGLPLADQLTAEGLVNGDTIQSALLSSAGEPASALPGGYQIAVDSVAFEAAGNYAISFEGGTLTVDGVAPPTLPPPLGVVLPNTPGLPNPRDNLAVPGEGGEGALVAVSADVSTAETGLALVQGASTDMTVAAENCRSQESATDYLSCLSDVFSAYADAIDAATASLSPEFESVSDIIVDLRNDIDAAKSSAEIRLRSATTDAERRAIERQAIGEARAAISEAQGEIRNVISLIRADDPELVALQVETGNVIIGALATVDTQLARAVDL
jgi:hypothetical protein